MQRALLEKYLPHRGNMLLIDDIVRVDEASAVTKATVKNSWPLFAKGHASPFVLIELVAQTAGIIEGRMELTRNSGATKGFIVGIKNTEFFVGNIPENTIVTAFCEKGFEFDNYMQFNGGAEIDGEKAAQVVIQVISLKDGQEAVL